MPELSDQELATLRQGYQLLDQLLRNPKTSAATQRQIKALHPSVQTADDYTAPYLNALQGISQKVDKLEQRYDADRIDGSLSRSFESLRSHGYTDEGIEKIKRIMVEKRIADPMDAAAVWDKQNPPPDPSVSSLSPSSWGFGAETDDKDLMLLWKDPDAWAEKEAVAAWREASQIKY